MTIKPFTVVCKSTEECHTLRDAAIKACILEESYKRYKLREYPLFMYKGGESPSFYMRGTKLSSPSITLDEALALLKGEPVPAPTPQKKGNWSHTTTHTAPNGDEYTETMAAGVSVAEREAIVESSTHEIGELKAAIAVNNKYLHTHKRLGDTKGYTS